MYYYLLAIIALIITVSAQIYVNTKYNKYKSVLNSKKISGFEVTKKILEENNLSDVYVVETRGVLSDHYDPNSKVVRLSKEIFHGESISALAIAAHECGHAIQHKNGNIYMKIRSFLVPFVDFSTNFGYIIIILGLFLGILQLFYFGIALLFVLLLFQIATLPVEIGASKDALQYLKNYGLASDAEVDNVRSVLISAALTYVASLATTVLEILRLIFLSNRD